jgi:TolB protein
MWAKRSILLSVAAVALVIAVLIILGTRGLRITDLSPAGGASAVPITAPLRLTFSRQVDAAALQDYLYVEPALDGNLQIEGRQVTFTPHVAWSPATTYTITLEAGLPAVSGPALARAHTWHFYTRQPQLLYLARTGDDVRQLFASPLDGGASQQLTDHPLGAWDYAAHPQGEFIVYSALRPDGGSDLWRLDRDGERRRQLLACPDQACLNPVWSPDGRQIAYERRPLRVDGLDLDPQAGQIWLLDLEKDETVPLFDYEVPAHAPAWSPDGRRLAYASPLAGGIEVYDLSSQDLSSFPNEWGATPVWSPDGAYLVVPELMLAGEDLVVGLVRIDIASGDLLDVSGGQEMVHDVAPAWSPAGGWIAFGRQRLAAENWTPGRQIWLARPDGSEAYPLLEEPMADHFGLRWRPDAAALAYARADLTEGLQPQPDVSVWVFDLLRRERFQVASDAVLPGWLP